MKTEDVEIKFLILITDSDNSQIWLHDMHSMFVHNFEFEAKKPQVILYCLKWILLPNKGILSALHSINIILSNWYDVPKTIILGDCIIWHVNHSISFTNLWKSLTYGRLLSNIVIPGVIYHFDIKIF